MHPIISKDNQRLPKTAKARLVFPDAVYLDDILIFTDTLEEHWLVTWCVMELMAKHKLYLKPDKCEFEQTIVEYLEVIISYNSVLMDLVEYKNGLSQPTRRKYSLS